MSEFDFIACPVYFVRIGSGHLLTMDGALCLWTDADAALSFVACSGERLPFPGCHSVIKVETDADLSALLIAAQQDGMRQVVVDVASDPETTGRMLYVVDLIDAIQQDIAPGVSAALGGPELVEARNPS